MLRLKALAAGLFATALTTGLAGAADTGELRLMVKQPFVVNMVTAAHAGCRLYDRELNFEFMMCAYPPRGQKRRFAAAHADGSGMCIITFASPPVGSAWVEANRTIRMTVSTQGPCVKDQSNIPSVNWDYTYNIIATPK